MDRQPGAPGRPVGPGGSPRGSWWPTLVVVAVSIGLFVWLLATAAPPSSSSTQSWSFTKLSHEVQAKTVRDVSVDPSGAITGHLRNGTAFTSQVPTALGVGDYTKVLDEAGVTVTATRSSTDWLGSALGIILPIALIIGAMIWLSRRAAPGAVGAGGAMGRSKAKVVDTEHPTVSLDDVAGYGGVKREIGEIVEFLRQPGRYRLAGAVGPRGVLMVGPPGTGKTLLARAIAGEAAVPFLSVTGSAFVEMFVGVGAARVRDLFEQARKLAPAIIFIDEIDAIGQRRGGGIVSNDEREQTLNQLLAEMDGFDPAEGVVVLAATNRPDVLDPALMRPGRFDRQVVVPLPNQTERLAILRVHCANKRLDPDVDLDAVSRSTPGFSGADLANLANEAAIHAVRQGRTGLAKVDFSEARDRILLGIRDSSNVLLPEEKRAVAVHEAGHALVAALRPDTDPVEKITILPNGRALGFTEQLPIAERHLLRERQLLSVLDVRLGGRAAELVCFGEGSSGAANDLAEATQLASRMVRELGLSSELGPVGYGTESPMYLGREQVSMRQYSEATQHVVDAEVARLLREAETRAVTTLRTHRDDLEALADLLIEEETVDGAAVYRLLGQPVPERYPAADDRAGSLTDTAAPAKPDEPETGPAAARPGEPPVGPPAGTFAPGGHTPAARAWQ